MAGLAAGSTLASRRRLANKIPKAQKTIKNTMPKAAAIETKTTSGAGKKAGSKEKVSNGMNMRQMYMIDSLSSKLTCNCQRWEIGLEEYAAYSACSAISGR